MSVKDILVALSPRSESDRGREYALSMASQFGARLTGVIYAVEPPRSFSMYAEFTSELIERHVIEEKKAAQTARERFVAAAAKAGVANEFHSASGLLGGATADFVNRLRTADLAVLAQHDGAMEHVGDVFFESALFHSGRPVIVVPNGQSSAFSVNRVLIAWDGSAHAARAVASAMPLLPNAGDVTVLTVAEAGKPKDLRGSELVKNLRLHGVNAAHSERASADPAETILDEAKTFGATLTVMGGYGHSRLREFILGGVTRSVLKSMPSPVLMAH